MRCSPIIIHYTNQHSEGEGKQLPGILAQMTSCCTFSASDGELVENPGRPENRGDAGGGFVPIPMKEIYFVCEKSNGTELKCTNRQKYGTCME